MLTPSTLKISAILPIVSFARSSNFTINTFSGKRNPSGICSDSSAAVRTSSGRSIQQAVVVVGIVFLGGDASTDQYQSMCIILTI